MAANDNSTSSPPTVDDLHIRLNDAVAAAGALASVLRVIAAESSEQEIRNLAEQALASPTVAAVLETPPASRAETAGKD